MLAPYTCGRGNYYPAYVWPGGYPLFYLGCSWENPYDRSEFVVCPDCANDAIGAMIGWILMGGDEAPYPYCEPEADIIACDVHWEGPPEFCEICNAEIESAYGDPDEPETEPVYGP